MNSGGACDSWALSGGRGRECTTGVANGSVSVAQRILPRRKAVIRCVDHQIGTLMREYGSGFARRKTGASYSSTLARTQFLLDASAFANRSHRLVLGTPSSRLATSKKSSCRAWLCMAIGLLIASKRCAKDASRCDSTDYLRAQRVSASPLRKSALALQAHCSPKNVATATPPQRFQDADRNLG